MNTQTEETRSVTDDDRRTERRLDKVFSVYLSCDWGNAFGIARNISERGMFIEAHDPYPLGCRVLITFSFPGSHAEMTALAEVVHLCFVNQTPAGGLRKVMVGMGVRFLRFLQEEQRAPALSQMASVQ
jgi:hypothetical protein